MEEGWVRSNSILASSCKYPDTVPSGRQLGNSVTDPLEFLQENESPAPPIAAPKFRSGFRHPTHAMRAEWPPSGFTAHQPRRSMVC